jgi:hypothetical protein
VAPSVGWLSSPDGPDQPDEPYGILGASKPTQGRGTFAEYILVKDHEIFPLPVHLEGSWAEAASFPLGGLTAYRAVFTKAGVKKGQNVLITGTLRSGENNQDGRPLRICHIRNRRRCSGSSVAVRRRCRYRCMDLLCCVDLGN